MISKLLAKLCRSYEFINYQPVANEERRHKYRDIPLIKLTLLNLKSDAYELSALSSTCEGAANDGL